MRILPRNDPSSQTLVTRHPGSPLHHQRTGDQTSLSAEKARRELAPWSPDSACAVERYRWVVAGFDVLGTLGVGSLNQPQPRRRDRDCDRWVCSRSNALVLRASMLAPAA